MEIILYQLFYVGSSDDILDGHKMDRITNIKSRVTNFLGGSSIPNTLKV